MLVAVYTQQRCAAKIPPLPDQIGNAVEESASIEPAQKLRIPIVEDEYLVAMTLENELTDAGYEIVGVASSADEACRLARTAKPNLIIMDIRLVGNRDGVDAALKIYEETGLRCVFATANVDERSKQRAMPACPLGWLQKPYHKAALLAAVEDAFDELSGR